MDTDEHWWTVRSPVIMWGRKTSSIGAKDVRLALLGILFYLNVHRPQYYSCRWDRRVL